MLEAEERAETIEERSPGVIPGPLRTEAYARAVICAERLPELLEEADEKVNGRPARARLLETGHRALRYWAVLPESLAAPPTDQAPETARSRPIFRSDGILCCCGPVGI
ncbi:Scr1 family TA system antitoxin-like transcriptional regulator [Streptomyces sp. NPDC002669]|uniref:Scr1 family TA system antitoxin-like transcriptional regulator n=1 Tax=Streptomyces sp. NPDC002669 TaxID=3364658 RepID=UPI0036A4C3EC